MLKSNFFRKVIDNLYIAVYTVYINSNNTGIIIFRTKLLVFIKDVKEWIIKGKN